MRYTQLEAHLSKPRNRHKIDSCAGSSFQILTIIFLTIILLTVIFSSENTIRAIFGYSQPNSQSSSLKSSQAHSIRYGSKVLNKTLESVLTFKSDDDPESSETIQPSNNHIADRLERCSHHSCFDIYKCETLQLLPEHGQSRYFMSSSKRPRIKVYIYPRKRISNINELNISLEFSRILAAISNSSYLTTDPDKACLFIPNIDLLNGNNIQPNTLQTALWSQSNFKQMLGSNHLLFSFSLPYLNSSQQLSSSHFGFNIGNSMVAAGSFDLNRFQTNFDISIPTYSAYSRLYEDESYQLTNFDRQFVRNLDRQFKVISVQSDTLLNNTLNQLLELESQYKSLSLFNNSCFPEVSYQALTSINLKFPNQNLDVKKLYENSIFCSYKQKTKGKYIDILHRSRYCLLFPDKGNFSLSLLSDFLMSGCVPIIVIDNLVLPFEDNIDWNRASIRVWFHQLSFVLDIISSISVERENNLREYGLKIWKNYFSQPEVIALNVLDVINNRIFQQISTNSYRISDEIDANFDRSFSSLSPKGSNLNFINSGFTTVILSFNRIEKLFEIIVLMNKIPSCVKIIVVWNSLTIKPPKKFPNIVVPVEIIQSHSNKLSNRFFPYSSIETEGIFSIDDDITMLNVDEIEFAYQTWLQFPDRIVGFPSRLHVWNNETQAWTYNSEWKNKVSIILTGAAFYHRYYNYVYTFLQDSQIRDYVDKNMNCEDIAMNFLVSNLTCSAPIKVTPRKKFKCPDCPTPNMMSLDSFEHLQKRSKCVEFFQQIYGHIPLKAVEFRANPVLYKDNIPDKLKLFGSIGQL